MYDWNEAVRSLNVGLPDDIARLKAAGYYQEAIARIDRLLAEDWTKTQNGPASNGIAPPEGYVPPENPTPHGVDALREALTVQKEIMRRLPGEYCWTEAEAIARMQERVRDFTAEEFKKLDWEGRMDWRVGGLGHGAVHNGAVVHDDGVAGGLQLGNAVVVGLDGGAGGVDALAGGHIGPVGGRALLGVIELAQLDVSLLNGVLLAQVGGLQLGDLGQALGLGHTRLSQSAEHSRHAVAFKHRHHDSVTGHHRGFFIEHGTNLLPGYGSASGKQHYQKSQHQESAPPMRFVSRMHCLFGRIRRLAGRVFR